MPFANVQILKGLQNCPLRASMSFFGSSLYLGTSGGSPPGALSVPIQIAQTSFPLNLTVLLLVVSACFLPLPPGLGVNDSTS